MSNHKLNTPYIYKNDNQHKNTFCIKCGVRLEIGDSVVQRCTSRTQPHIGAKRFGHLIHTKCVVDAKGRPIFE
jgi:hypothetical protein